MEGKSHSLPPGRRRQGAPLREEARKPMRREAIVQRTIRRRARKGRSPWRATRIAGWLIGSRSDLVTASDDLARLHCTCLPTLGAMSLEAVRPRHIRDLVLDLRKGGVLAPRSVRHVYAIAAMHVPDGRRRRADPVHAVRTREGHPPEEHRQGRLVSRERDLHARGSAGPDLGRPRSSRIAACCTR